MFKKIVILLITFICTSCSNTSQSIDTNETIDVAVKQTINVMATQIQQETSIPTKTLTINMETTDTPRPTIEPVINDYVKITPQKLNTDSSGRILFRWRREDTYRTYDELIMMDGNGNNLQKLGEISGPPAWSPSGRWVAFGCEDTSSGEVFPHDYDRIASAICVIDTSTISDPRQFPDVDMNLRPSRVANLRLPQICLDIKPSDSYNSNNFYSGIASLSWSYDETRLAVVCGTSGDRLISESAKLKTCIMSLTGESECWDTELSKEITRAVWSPIENVLAVSTIPDEDSKIYIVDPDGSNPTFLTNGSNVEWSPDGTHIAFFRYIEYPSYGGIAVLNVNGGDFNWLHKDSEQAYLQVPFCAEDCPITWSPDGKYLAFVASNQYGGFNQRLYRLDIQTGDIIILVDPYFFGDWVVMPDWGP